MIFDSIKKLVTYAEENFLITPIDRVWATNRILEALDIQEYIEPETEYSDVDLENTLCELLDYAAEKGLIEENSVAYRDLFDTKLMGLLTPAPREVVDTFTALYSQSPEDATDYYYKLSRDTDYIRTYRVKKDLRWKYESDFGELDITVNLSKPEKDPKAIAAARNAAKSAYPKCALCHENEGYAGHLNAAARQNHRTIPIIINDSQWYLQYSPYVYYNEHCIAFNGEHTPMKIDRAAFCKLLDFVTLFPHYFLGSNADLPIVGGSILSHDHFQGGRYEFAMTKAPIEKQLELKGFEDVDAGLVKWPLTTIRLSATDKDRIIELADKILAAWRGYTDESAFIFAETDGEPHSTITPIARRRGEKYELDLVLRNNITTDEYPLGVYHPHEELHHIKKENIGLIEVMGLAVLPARLKNEMDLLKKAILAGADLEKDEVLAKHAAWAYEFMEKQPVTAENIDEIVEREIGKVFATVLEHAGVYKCTPEGRRAFDRFVEYVNK
ncbi:MAG: UDP-glucose--hexose-1-phosphate uridylyltransferase [Clostridia bacterium]|nr:UDP-glucose--hexose-1-phosphate uridylyltransferase [Clostridia bacterium]